MIQNGTFSAEDVIRIYNQHLTSEERSQVDAWFLEKLEVGPNFQRRFLQRAMDAAMTGVITTLERIGEEVAYPTGIDKELHIVFQDYIDKTVADRDRIPPRT